MTGPPATDWTTLTGPYGLDLLRRYLSGDQTAAPGMLAIINAANAGRYDANYAGVPDPVKIHVTASCHLMVLALLHRLTGLSAAQFYKQDPQLYVRMNCLVQRMLGIKRLTLGWPVYGFGAEILGQTMIYPQDQAPGSDPGVPLLNAENWRELPGYDPDHPLARAIRENLLQMAQLGGIDPVAHIPAPYSLAAEIFGQEPLIAALALDADFVHDLLDLITTRVLAPWCADLVANVPNVWLELSDASGSPMFVGPDNFLKFAVGPVCRLIDENPWGDRVFTANYRGDLPSGEPTRGRRRHRAQTSSNVSFESMLEAKKLCCPNFLMRLEADAAPLSRYEASAIDLQMPLYIGIGAVRLDRNSTVDIEAGITEITQVARIRATTILKVANSLDLVGRSRAELTWPGDLYIEDINAETNIDLIQAVLAGAERA